MVLTAFFSPKFYVKLKKKHGNNNNSFRKLRTNFVDDSFRPCNKSVFGEEATTSRDQADPSNGSHGNAVTWLRPHEIDAGYPGIKWTVFRTPLPTDIVQGRFILTRCCV